MHFTPALSNRVDQELHKIDSRTPINLPAFRKFTKTHQALLFPVFQLVAQMSKVFTLEPGDIILKFDGKTIEKSVDLPRLVGNTKPGARSTVTVFRRGSTKDLTVTIGEVEPERVAQRPEPKDTKPPVTSLVKSLGLNLSELTDEIKSELKLSGGVRIDGAEGAAARAGLREGDVILVDGDSGTVVVRPSRPLTHGFEQRMAMSQKRRAQYAALKNMPSTTILTPIDLGAPVIFWTRHSLVATPHHRNKDAMADSIRIFAGDPAKAETLVRQHGATLIVFCRTANDLTKYRHARKDALAAQLYAGKAPGWLEAVPIASRAGLSVWRVKPLTK